MKSIQEEVNEINNNIIYEIYSFHITHEILINSSLKNLIKYFIIDCKKLNLLPIKLLYIGHDKFLHKEDNGTHIFLFYCIKK